MHPSNHNTTGQNDPSGKQVANPDFRADLDWLAFQYIAGEFSEGERISFEDRLATQQDAREAVARAVQLCQATAVALQPIKPVQLADRPNTRTYRPRTYPWSRGRNSAICGIAGAIALAIMLIPQLPMWNAADSPNSGDSLRPTSDVQDLAMMWATARKDLSADLNDMDDALVEQAGNILDEREEIETPSWMLIAVAGSIDNRESQPPAVE